MKKLVHHREMKIRTYDLGDHCLLVEGSLIDHSQRLIRRSQSHRESKPVHHMTVRLKVRVPEMVIEEAEATMPHRPREGCLEVLPEIGDLAGLRIAKGYSTKVKELIGGTKGCAHLASLLTAMGPAAIQGYGAAHGEEVIPNLINTCYLWREDGPIVRELREAKKSKNSKTD
jgi:hypothetical protein